MGNKRLKYLDETKGFAIFLMVFAHAIAWSFEDWRAIMYPDTLTPNLVYSGIIWKFVYSFHMGLFFLVSGFLTYNHQSKDSIYLSIKKKTFRLLIPYFVTGGLIILIRPGFGYWFLFSLWEISIIGILIIKLLELINKKNRLWIDITVFIISYFVLRKLLSLEILNNPVADIEYGITFYLPFVIGIIIRKYPNVEMILSKHFSLLLIAFLFCFISKEVKSEFWILKIILTYLQRAIDITHSTDIFGSLTIFYLFKQGVNNKVGNILSFLGRHTFEIYILHVFFVARIPQIGQFWLGTNLPTCLTTQIIYATIATSIAILISISIANLIKHSQLLSKLFFGQ